MIGNKCCRSTPRCAGCPVRMAVAGPRRAAVDETARLVAEVLEGRPRRSLPPSVVAALEVLRAAEGRPALARRAGR